MEVVLRILYYLVALIVLVGGVNWLMTGINNMDAKKETDIPDLLDTLGLHQDVSNWVYIIVFVCTILFVLASVGMTFHSGHAVRQVAQSFVPQNVGM
jgi:uncharacterized membrane protein YuzA (DUF378 family)